MTATTLDSRPAPTTARRGAFGVTPARVLRSEWTKFRSLRSSGWTLLVAFVLTAGIGTALSAVEGGHYNTMSAAAKATFDPVSTSLSGLSFAELATGVLGALMIAGEYGTGAIRSSLTVVPTRLPVLWGKIVIAAAASFVVMVAASFTAFFAGQALLDQHHLGTSIGADGALRSVFGAALAVAVVTVIGLSLGALLRDTAGAISTFVGVFFVLPPLMALLPASWDDTISPYLPSNAAGAQFGNTIGGSSLSPWAGFGVLCAYAAALVAVTAWQLRQRDA